MSERVAIPIPDLGLLYLKQRWVPIMSPHVYYLKVRQLESALGSISHIYIDRSKGGFNNQYTPFVQLVQYLLIWWFIQSTHRGTSLIHSYNPARNPTILAKEEATGGTLLGTLLGLLRQAGSVIYLLYRLLLFTDICKQAILSRAGSLYLFDGAK